MDVVLTMVICNSSGKAMRRLSPRHDDSRAGAESFSILRERTVTFVLRLPVVADETAPVFGVACVLKEQRAAMANASVVFRRARARPRAEATGGICLVWDTCDV